MIYFLWGYYDLKKHSSIELVLGFVNAYFFYYIIK
jgi:hypothetical protein